MFARPRLTSQLYIPFLILITVCVANAPYLFIDMLWHDDGQWYFRASEQTILDLDWRGKVTSLSPYLDLVYAHGMVEAGLPATRGLFVLIMGLGSIAMYFVYRRLGFSIPVALTAAVIPNILQSLRGIPVGLNASYALWGLAPFAAALLCLDRYFTNTTKSVNTLSIAKPAWTWLAASFVLFYLALNLPGQPATNFLIPNFLLFFALYLIAQPKRAIVSAIPFALLGLWMLYKQAKFTHIQPTEVPADVVLDRAIQFLEMSGFLGFNTVWGVTASAILAGFGVVCLVFQPSLVAKAPNDFAQRGWLFAGFLLLWSLGWVSANSIAYLGASNQFRPYDYAYTFNFGMVLLQVIGLFGALSLALRWLSTPHIRSSIAMGMAFVLLCYAGYNRWTYALHPWGWKAHHQRTTVELRNNLVNREIPYRAQILILGKNLGVFYNKGLHLANSGYMRYLLDRKDVTGLIGPDTFPGDVFAPWEGWFTHMRGFDPNQPIAAFRRVPGGKLNRVDLLLRTQSNPADQHARLQWTLYDISAATADRHNKPLMLAQGNGISSYEHYMQHEVPDRFQKPDVAFAPPDDSDRFVSRPELERLHKETEAVLTEAVNAGSHLEVVNVFKTAAPDGSNKTRFNIVLNVKNQAPNSFRLGYRFNNETITVPLWSYAQPGDTLLLTTPAVTPATLAQGLELVILNTGTFPHVPQATLTKTGKATSIKLLADRSR